MLRINAILCFLIILFGCFKKETEIKLYKTTVNPHGLQMFTDVDSYRNEVIFKIPFKSKVEMVDNKKHYIPDDKIVSWEYSKIKYEGTVGYVLSIFLSERDAIPFVDNVKYDLKINEFDYDRNTIIKTAINCMRNNKNFKTETKYYYIEDPQIFTLYGKNCDDSEAKIVAVLMISKLTPLFNRMFCFSLEDNELVPFAEFPVYSWGIEKTIETARQSDICYDL